LTDSAATVSKKFMIMYPSQCGRVKHSFSRFYLLCSSVANLLCILWYKHQFGTNVH